VKQFITFLFSWGVGSIIANFVPNFVLWQRESMGENAIGSIQWPVPENFNIGAKISHKSLTQAEFKPMLSQISLPWQRGSVGEKCNWQHSMAHPQNPPIGAKISYTSRVQANFVPNFVAIATEVGRGKCNWQHSMAHPRKPPYRRKNLPKIFYASQVMANFVPNFVATATGVGRGKMPLAAFDCPSPKTPL